MKKISTYQLTLTAIFIGILIFQTFVPFLGYIPIPPLNLTIIHITVIIGALIIDRPYHIIVGIAWGLLSASRAYIAPTSPFDILIFQNFIIAVVPRALIPIAARLVFDALREKNDFKLAASAGAIVGTIVNTAGVLGLIALIKGEQYATLKSVDVSQIYKLLGAVVLTNGVPEVIAAAIIVPTVVTIYLKTSKFRTHH
ncbi:ECF transporter S component [Atopobacter phocae]|uniref:ECF transporter S component n=1 Tax=Atopobacter phocae TaxID=136492 RepID=UPI0004725675|nr:ECF transporter S component [Atopobacter phocae]